MSQKRPIKWINHTNNYDGKSKWIRHESLKLTGRESLTFAFQKMIEQMRKKENYKFHFEKTEKKRAKLD